MKRLATAALAAAAALALPGAGLAQSDESARGYVVVFSQTTLPAGAASLVASAGGTVVRPLPALGAVQASSASPRFAATLLASGQVVAVGSEEPRHLLPRDVENRVAGAPPAAAPPAPPGMDPLYGLQWDKTRIGAAPTGSYALERGRRSVVVAVLDSGVDPTHPDVAPGLDLARSRSFVPSEPDLVDRDGHGTWCASAIAAPINGVGMSGVAPNVTILALKVLDGSGNGTFVGIAQALVYAADAHVDVASMSLGAYLDPTTDKADYELMRRAVRYARANGVLPVAAAGNDDLDLGDTGRVDELPAELPDVLAVSATGYLDGKAYYSNYGGTIDLAAPGGDRRFQLPPAPLHGGGRVLGAWPAADLDAVDPSLRETDCGPSGCATYAWEQGTSMAAPQVAGVAALVVSRLGTPRLAPSATERILLASATPHACPDPRTVSYDVPAGILATNTATCQGGTSSNGFYGSGIVNALRAVSGK